MDHDKPPGSSMFSGAQHFSAIGGQYNATGRDMRQGVVVHINYSEGRDTASPQAAVPPPVLPNPADAPGEPRTNMDFGPSPSATYCVANAEHQIQASFKILTRSDLSENRKQARTS